MGFSNNADFYRKKQYSQLYGSAIALNKGPEEQFCLVSFLLTLVEFHSFISDILYMDNVLNERIQFQFFHNSHAQISSS